MQKTLRVTGKGKVSATPDIIILLFDVESHEWEYEDAIKNLNKKVETLREITGSFNIDRKKLITIDFHINRLTSWDSDLKKHIFNGFRASHPIELELPLDNQLINNIILKIINEIEGLEFRIRFGVMNPEKYEQLLIEKSIHQAKKNAEIIAKSAGIKLEDIVDINYSFNEVYFRSDEMDYQLNESYSMAEAPMPDVNPDDIKLTETITITWKIS